MDTPLYVLSTAASMVESVDVTNFKPIESASFKRTVDQESVPRKSPPRKSPPREPPPKYHTLQTRRTVAKGNGNTAKSNDDDALNNSKKCAGTQTSFTSFSSSSYQGMGAPSSEKYMKTNDGSFARRSPSEWSPPPPYYSHHTAVAPAAYPPRYGNPSHDDMETDTMPLNLTTSSASHQNHSSNQNRSPSPSSPSSHRPSVITRGIVGGALPEERYSVERSHRPPCYSSGRASPISPAMSTGSNSNGTRPDSQTDVCDPEIEEHFRRSLATKYPDYATPQSRGSSNQDSSSNSSSHKNHNVSITGNVDDHFAKSLGDTWTKLNPPQKKKASADPGSVDDHFAKALGDTWFKIKAQKELGHSEIKSLSSGPRPHSSTVHL